MKLDQCKEYLLSTVGTNDLVLKHQTISSHSTE